MRTAGAFFIPTADLTAAAAALTTAVAIIREAAGDHH
jgi:hypothetical protein